MLADAITAEPNGEKLPARLEYPVTGRMGHYDELRMIAKLTKMLSGL
jgi:hypothetical protein